MFAMLTYPDINPVAIELGPLKVHWYGIMYLVAFLSAWWLGRRRARLDASWNDQQVADLIFYGAVGVIIGGRLGYTLFYNLPTFLEQPLTLFKIWEGGMSFHGGLLGVIVAMALFAHKTARGFFQVSDFVAPLVPIGLGAGRIGNFINGELPGRVTDVPWAMIYPHFDALPRHPSQLYQAFSEGLLLFLILWWYSSKLRPTMAVSGLFLLCYGGLRFTTEFAREPDAHLGFIALNWLTMGQLLSLPMVLCGAAFLWWSYQHHAVNPNNKTVE